MNKLILFLLPEEALWVVVAVDVDLGECVVCGRLLAAFVDAHLQPRQEQLQSTDKSTQGLLDSMLQT